MIRLWLFLSIISWSIRIFKLSLLRLASILILISITITICILLRSLRIILSNYFSALFVLILLLKLIVILLWSIRSKSLLLLDLLLQLSHIIWLISIEIFDHKLSLVFGIWNRFLKRRHILYWIIILFGCSIEHTRRLI
jgi:hypothetical protein